VDGQLGSNVYEVNQWLWQFGRGKQRLGGLSVESGTSTFFLKNWEIPIVWEISQTFKKIGKIWGNWSKLDQGDFLRLQDARDCTSEGLKHVSDFFREETSERTFTGPFYN
jgi:hypothetical protein